MHIYLFKFRNLSKCFSEQVLPYYQLCFLKEEGSWSNNKSLDDCSAV